MPKSNKLCVSDPAKKDLERIGEYTRRQSGAAQKRKYLGQIKDGFEAIRNTPGLGAPRNDIVKGIRARHARKHIIFYRQTRNGIVIVRMLHESMDPERHLT